MYWGEQNMIKLSSKKTQLIIIKIVLTIFKYLLILSILLLIARNIYIAFQPANNFTVTDVYCAKNVQINTSASTSIGITIPNNVMGYSSPDFIDRAKYAFFIYNSVYGGMNIVFSLLGIIFLTNLLDDTIAGKTPFSKKHIKAIKLISLFVCINFGLKDFIINILFSILIFKVNAIHLINIHLLGILFGITIYLIAIIFDYGKSLQEDADSIV